MSDEGKDLIALFEQLGTKPKAKDPSELLQWMKDFVAHKEDDEEAEPPVQSAHWGSHGSPKQVLSHQVRLPNFSGDGKGDATFDLWRYEVKCLQREHRSADVIRQAIRRSLRGEAARIAMRLGPATTVEELIQKFTSVYGEVEPQEVLLAKFYSARQRKEEDVSAWSCRWEDLLNKAMPKESRTTDTNKLLRVMFWSGLRDDLKDISGYLYESDKDYDQLRVAVRRIEQDHKVRQEDPSASVKKTTTPCKSSVADTNQFEKLEGMIQQLTTDVQTIKDDQKRLQSQREPDQSSPSMVQQSTYNAGYRNQRSNYRSRGNYRGNSNRWKTYEEPTTQATADSQREQRQPEDSAAPKDITCWKCGQVGHIAIGCRIRTDHRRGLNFGRPTPRGGQ